MEPLGLFSRYRSKISEMCTKWQRVVSILCPATWRKISGSVSSLTYSTTCSSSPVSSAPIRVSRAYILRSTSGRRPPMKKRRITGESPRCSGAVGVRRSGCRLPVDSRSPRSRCSRSGINSPCVPEARTGAPVSNRTRGGRCGRAASLHSMFGMSCADVRAGTVSASFFRQAPTGKTRIKLNAIRCFPCRDPAIICE